MPTTNFIPTPILTHGPRSYGRRDIPRRDYLPISSRPSYPEINDAQTTAVASFGGGCPGTFGPRATAEHANMWRISDDFWDHWSLLDAQFERLDRWSRWRRPGAWPDADMIPVGTIEMGRKTW